MKKNYCCQQNHQYIALKIRKYWTLTSKLEDQAKADKKGKGNKRMEDRSRTFNIHLIQMLNGVNQERRDKEIFKEIMQEDLLVLKKDTNPEL